MSIRNCLFSIALLFITASTTFALPTYDGPEKSPSKALAEITTMIQGIDFDIRKSGEKTVKVKFLINSDNEIVVLSTSDKNLDRLIKYSLNYTELTSKELTTNKVYILPIVLKS